MAFDGITVFTKVDLDVVGVVGIVGENGAGKSCFLRALQGIRTDAVVALVTQGDGRSADVDGLDGAIDPSMRARFGVVADVSAARWPSLSPGERRRALLAAAFARAPDVILLDEPTNHLDDDGRTALIAAIGAFRGSIAIASHDRPLLDALCSSVLVLHRGEHLVVDGNATLALATFEGIVEARRGDRRRALQDVDQAQKRLGTARSNATKVEHQRRTKTRMKSIHDKDARGSLAKGRVQAAAKRIGREVEVRRRSLERATAAVLTVASAPKQLGRSFFADFEPSARARVASVHGPLMVGAYVVADRLDIDVGRTDRLRIAGPNGIGKTTLLRALAGVVPAGGHVLYLPQTLDDVTAPLRGLEALDREARGRTLQAVAALGVDPVRLLETPSPSPGEAKKLALALAFAVQVQALFLDEPTNHLDLPSVERLAVAIAAFPGAVVLVSHDDEFARTAGMTEVFDVAQRRRHSVLHARA